jgi:hypothetical protein
VPVLRGFGSAACCCEQASTCLWHCCLHAPPQPPIHLSLQPLPQHAGPQPRQEHLHVSQQVRTQSRRDTFAVYVQLAGTACITVCLTAAANPFEVLQRRSLLCPAWPSALWAC